MNQSHYPDLERCKRLTSLGFPNTELHWNDTLSDRPEIDREIYTLGGNPYVCPSVMEMVDVIADLPSDFTDHWALARNLPNAIADLIIWLVENSHITFDKR